MIRPPLYIAVTIALLPASTLAQTARPDWCPRATTPTERAFCDDAGLSALDLEMAAAYARRLRGADPAAVRADQRVWLDLRAACGTDAACLAGEYRARIGALSD
ncbi:MAG TPA: hypothetical protein VLA78_05160 [Paracoccaceae bacterium]|nr:hypothetical protein [Paracoccaceae bacterium]